ncbi:hypothetical protein [Bacteriovorax sp. Seq25_V]|uniref:hypothetical protein n=1 Tax=Bacteriovorax sp. Seq25_V TaxID=1201288 RepID=UPI00038A33C5|nr:hypothetical protein [Bacteriovorax sp. Seq25_V]EQC45684.1 hypothetical protein M900_2037 [Bacteriovorax sp. Seq25_V]
MIKLLLLVNFLFANSNSDFEAQVKHRLQEEVLFEYLPGLQASLGECEDENCLIENSDHLSLKTKDDEVCLPYTQCGFYNCMEKKYGCSEVGVNYFTGLAFPTCSTYLENIKKNYFTEKGIQWIYSVMVCLQKGLIDECEVRGNCQKETKKKTCDYITDFTLDFHPGCYINSGVGVCHLPMKDKLNIWRTVSKYLTKDERKQAYKVVFNCILPTTNF